MIDANTAIIGVRLRPGVAHRLLDVSARDLLNLDVSLHALWPHGRAAMWEDAVARETLPARLIAIEEAIAARLETMGDADAFVREAATWIARHPFAPVAEIGRLSGLSDRQMRRRFDLAVGYGPKTLQRIMRLQYLLWLASQGHALGRDLSRLAFAAGYADQPHMTREVGALTGASPRQLLFGTSPASAVSDFFKTEAPGAARLTIPLQTEDAAGTLPATE
jgi:AraC-like DNA-binding protein